VTLEVTDSTNKIVTKVVTMDVFDPPTAAIPATGQAQVGMPFTFPLTATTPSGTAFQSWSLYGDWLAGNYGAAPPATLTHTFTEAGTYSFTFAVTNDAQGEASSSTLVVTVQ
jgi:plastocyanin